MTNTVPIFDKDVDNDEKKSEFQKKLTLELSTKHPLKSVNKLFNKLLFMCLESYDFMYIGMFY